MLIQNQVGPVATTTSISAGLQAPARAGQLGDTIVSELHGRYYETAYRRNLFLATNPSGVATSAGIIASAAAYTGLILYNPTGNTNNLVVNKVGASFPVAPAAAITFGLTTLGVVSATATLTAANTRNLYLGGAAPTALSYSVGTFTYSTTATIAHIFGTVGTTASITGINFVNNLIDLEGGLVIPPGYAVSMYTSTASGAAGFLGTFQWEEVPV
jgi:hypothetical protein